MGEHQCIILQTLIHRVRDMANCRRRRTVVAMDATGGTSSLLQFPFYPAICLQARHESNKPSSDKNIVVIYHVSLTAAFWYIVVHLKKRGKLVLFFRTQAGRLTDWQRDTRTFKCYFQDLTFSFRSLRPSRCSYFCVNTSYPSVVTLNLLLSHTYASIYRPLIHSYKSLTHYHAPKLTFKLPRICPTLPLLPALPSNCLLPPPQAPRPNPSLSPPCPHHSQAT